MNKSNNAMLNLFKRIAGIAVFSAAAVLSAAHAQLPTDLPDEDPDEYGVQMSVETALGVDPRPVAAFPATVGDTISVRVGEALDIPFTLDDAGRNMLGVQYVLDGVPLRVARPFPVLVPGFSAADQLRQVEAEVPEFGGILVESPAYILHVPFDQHVSFSLDWDGLGTGYSDSRFDVYQWSDSDGVGAFVLEEHYDGDSNFLPRGEYLVVVRPGIGWEYPYELMTEPSEGGAPENLVSPCSWLNDSACEDGLSFVFSVHGRGFGTGPMDYYGTSDNPACGDGNSSGGYDGYGDGYGYGGGSTGGWGGYGGGFEFACDDGPAFDLGTHFVRYVPETQADRAIRYRTTRHAYRFREEDIGSHHLAMVVQELTATGVQETQLRTFAIEVQPAEGCAAPTMAAADAQRPVYLPAMGINGWVQGGDYEGIRGFFWDWMGNSFISEYTNPNFQPLSMRITAAGGPAQVEVVNDLPVGDTGLTVGDYLWSADGVTFVLRDEAPYRALVAAGRTELVVRATAGCGFWNELQVPLDIRPSPVPQVALRNPVQELQFMQAELGALDIEVTDAGRDVLGVAAVLYPRGWDPSNAGLSTEPAGYGYMAEIGSPIGSQAWWRGQDQMYLYYMEAQFGTPANRIDRDNFDFRLPTSVFAPAGDYDLRFVVQELDGRITITDATPATVLPSPIPPTISVIGPEYMVPPGESFGVQVGFNKLGAVDRLDLEMRGPNSELIDNGSIDLGDIDVDLPSQGSEYWRFMFDMPAEAATGDVYSVKMTIHDASGQSAMGTVQVSVGNWGEHTVRVTNYANIDDSMRFARVVVGAGGNLFIGHSSIPVDAIVVESGGIVRVGRSVGTLSARSEIRVDAGGELVAETVGSSTYLSEGGRHGGDYRRDYGYVAYGDFRKPRFPGGSSSYWYYRSSYSNHTGIGADGGGALKLTAPSIFVDGAIRADGEPAPSNYSYYTYYGSGAGGSIEIEANQLSGSGTITANGGPVVNSSQYAGAGGRIAIYYDSYQGDTDSPATGMTIEARTGTGPAQATNSSGAGTVFLKASSQSYGELYIDARGLTGSRATTTLPSIGRRKITAVGPIDGQPGRYWIESQGASWEAASAGDWQTGLAGMTVSLDAETNSAPLYTVLDNTANRLIVAAAALPDVVGNDLVGVIRLDRLTTTAGTRVYTRDRIHADRFIVAEAESLAAVDDLFTDEVIDVANINLDGENGFYVANVRADSLAVRNAEVLFRGNLTVAGNALLDGAVFRATTTGTIEGSLTVEGETTVYAPSLTVEGNLYLTDSTLVLATEQPVEVGGDAVLSGAARVTVPVPTYNGPNSKEAYDLRLNVAGTARIGEDAAIDVSERGRPAGYTLGWSRFGGGGFAAGPGGSYYENFNGDLRKRSYGDFRSPSHAGAAGGDTASGGVMHLAASQLELDGRLLANGQPSASGNGTGAGGSILVKAGSFTGTGRIEASGGHLSGTSTDLASGAGGRVAVHSEQAIAFAGTIAAESGAIDVPLDGSDSYGPKIRKVGAAGTVFLREGASGNGRLIIDNGGRPSGQPTVLRYVDRFPIVQVSEDPNGYCRVTVDGTLLAPAATEDWLGLRGLWIDLDAASRDGAIYQIADNDETNLWLHTVAGSCPAHGSELVGVVALDHLAVRGGALLKTADRLRIANVDGLDLSTTELMFGDLVVGGSVGWEQLAWPPGAALTLSGNQTLTSLSVHNYSLDVRGNVAVSGDLTVQGASARFAASSVIVGGNASVVDVPQDLLIRGDFTLGEPNTADSVHWHFFDVLEPGRYVTSASGLDGTVGYILFNVDTSSGQPVYTQFGFTEPAGYAVSQELPAGRYLLAVGAGVDSPTFGSDVLLARNSSVGNVSYRVQVRKDPTNRYWAEYLPSERVSVTELTVAGNLTLTNAAIAANRVVTPGTVALRDGSSLWSPEFDFWNWPETVDPLEINAASMEVDASSQVSVAGRGDYGYWNCGDWQGGSHGADSTSDAVPSYGDWLVPSLPGNCGRTVTEMAGGVLNISVGRLVNLGLIDASADVLARASGGSITIDVDVIEGNGAILAEGGNINGGYRWWQDNAGGGGRIVLVYGDRNGFAGTISAAGGINAVPESIGGQQYPAGTGGAGSVYIRQRDSEYGTLRFSNREGRTGQIRPTTAFSRIRSVGFHAITDVVAMDGKRLRVTVEGEPWDAPENSVDQLGLKGLWVDLDAAGEEGPFYRIETNGSNYLVLEDVDDAGLAVPGNQLIGVVQLRRLEVQDGARFATADRVVITDFDGLVIGDDVTALEFGQLSGWEDKVWPTGFQLALKADQNLASLTVSDWRLTVDGELNVGSALSIGGTGGYLSAQSIRAGGDVLITEALVQTNMLSSSGGNLTLLEGGVLSPLDPVNDDYHPLDIDFAGTVALYGAARIDATAKGKRSHSYGGSNAGRGGYSSNNGASNPSYGTYRHAEHAGEGGRASNSYNARWTHGGGVIRISATALELNDSSIVANGETLGYSVFNGPAGGSIEIAVDRFSGNAPSIIAADASPDSATSGGGGGRIRVHAEEDAYLGGVSARGSAQSSASSRNGSAGTVFRSVAGNADELTVANVSSTGAAPYMSEHPTLLEAIGRHRIAAVSPAEREGEYYVELERPVELTGSGGTINDNTFRFHKLEVRRPVEIVLVSEPTDETVGFRVFRGSDPAALTAGDEITQYGRDFLFYFSATLDRGQYLIAVGATADNWFYSDDVIANVNPYTPESGVDYTLTYSIDEDELPLAQDRNVTGFEVDLDADTPGGTLYTVVSAQDGYRLLVSGAEDPTAFVGKELVGVHRLHRLNVNKAIIDFGADRLMLTDVAGSSVSADSEVRAANVDAALLAALTNGGVGGSWRLGDGARLSEVVLDGTRLYFDGDVTIDNGLTTSNGAGLSSTGRLVVGGAAQLGAGSLVSATELQADSLAATDTNLELQRLIAAGDAELNGSSVLTVPAPSRTPLAVYTLDASVGGTFTIGTSARVDLDAKGYPQQRYPGDDSRLSRCHGGVRSDATGRPCVYGQYTEATFPGAGSASYSSSYPTYGIGGGYGRITAGTLRVDGTIRANGSGTSSYVGAGGGLDVSAGTLEGAASGRIEAKGARSSSSSYASAGGGRISVRVPDGQNLYAGTLDAAGGSYSTTYQTAGAGTVLVGASDTTSELIVRNANRTAGLGSTPVGGVGRRTVQSVDEIANNRWEIGIGANQEVHLAGNGVLNGGTGESMRHVPFTLTTQRTVYFRVSTIFSGRVYLVDADTWSYITRFYPSSSGTPYEFSWTLPAGNYVLAIPINDPGTWNVRYPDSYGSSSSGGAYSYVIDTWEGTWLPTSAASGVGLQGLYVDLDAANIDGPYYRILSNTDESFVIESTEPLDPIQLVGREIIGVHRFRRLNVSQGGSIDFGGDRVIVEDLAGSATNGRVINADAGSVLPAQ